MTLEKDYLDFIKLLNNHQVRYLVIGGYAMIAHDEPRLTKDIDIWVEAEEKNATKVVTVINEFGFGGMKVEEKDFLAKNIFIQLGMAPVRIDITSDISGVSFGEAYSKRKDIEITEGIHIPVIGIHELILNKRSSGRKQDLADVERLEKVLKAKTKK